MLSSQYGFKELIGVEFSPELAEAAHKNLSIFYSNDSPNYKPPYRILNNDVINFTIPQGNNVIFLCNPFNENILYSSRIISQNNYFYS